MLKVEPGQLHERRDDHLIYATVLWGGGLELHYQNKSGTVLQRIYRDDGEEFYNMWHKPLDFMVPTGLMFRKEGLAISCMLSNQGFRATALMLDPQRKRFLQSKA